MTTALQIGVEKDALIVPAEVVQHGQNGLYVFVVDDQNRAEVRQVKVAHHDTPTAVISDGLKEGDRVVTSGQFLLQPGSIVSIDDGKRSLADVQGHLRLVHSSSDRDHAHYGRDSAGRPGRFSFASRCASAAGRLPDHHRLGFAARRLP